MLPTYVGIIMSLMADIITKIVLSTDIFLEYAYLTRMKHIKCIVCEIEMIIILN